MKRVFIVLVTEEPDDELHILHFSSSACNAMLLMMSAFSYGSTSNKNLKTKRVKTKVMVD